MSTPVALWLPPVWIHICGPYAEIKSLVRFADALDVAVLDLFERITTAPPGEAQPRTAPEESPRDLKNRNSIPSTVEGHQEGVG